MAMYNMPGLVMIEGEGMMRLRKTGQYSGLEKNNCTMNRARMVPMRAITNAST